MVDVIGFSFKCYVLNTALSVRVYGARASRQLFFVHPFQLSVVVEVIPPLDELYRRTAAFIQRCLYSDCVAVSAIAKMSVLSPRMSSPLGRNSSSSSSLKFIYFAILTVPDVS